jgi:DNA repair exonuclease SbcCD ATPase subunit
MTLKEKLNNLISQLTGDNAEALKQSLRECISDADTMSEALLQANNESKSRKEKLRTLESEMSDLKEQSEKLKNNEPELTRLKGIETEYLNSKKAGFEKRHADWMEKQKKLKVEETDPQFDKIEKVKGQFVYADDKTQLTDEQLAANEKAYSLLSDINFFAEDNSKAEAFPRAGGGNNSLISKEQAAINVSQGKL